MKKLLFLSFFATVLIANAQNTFPFPFSGSVGIGTTAPSTELEVVGTILGDQILATNPIPDGSAFKNYGERNAKCLVFGAGTKFDPGEYTFNVFDFPQSNLNPQSQALLGLDDRNWKSRWRFFANTGGSSELLYYDKNQSPFFNLIEDGNNNVVLNMSKVNSYVTIGTNSYNDNGVLYKLTVNGKIRANSVKVYTDWADFVFEDAYKLPTLEEVENFINVNGHLENIPSAKEVEINGIELGEMNKLLLQKIEELTLYTIELQKQVNVLKSKIEEL